MMPVRVKSRMCTQAQLESEEFQDWRSRIQAPPERLHRKLWEFCYIAAALEGHGLLRPGCRGLGFAVGQEPLAALFASRGCEVVATDAPVELARASGWDQSSQHSDGLEALPWRGICDRQDFLQRVSYRSVDMHRIPDDLRGFDFIWSSCSLEHLGSIKDGIKFIFRSLSCLRPGGVAVHTTEFNVSSNSATLESGPTVLFRRSDLERVAGWLRRLGHRLDLDFSEGTGPADRVVDRAPYSESLHLKLDIFGYVATSYGLVVECAPG